MSELIDGKKREAADQQTFLRQASVTTF